ncbi:MAG: superoxide dismutase [Alphaproteobacteria bacterium]|nr:superoxide dismutase [Alphaproteobacteria bacterium]
MFTLSQFPLPYASDALAPYISAETLSYHHGKHVATYINNLNELITGTAYETMPLTKIVRTSLNNDQKIFNNAAQVYNHDFFFNCLRPANKQMEVPEKLAAAFGGKDELRNQFRTAALSVFGSGWAWIVYDGGSYKIITTANADTPIAHGMTPIFTIDVWEHAYYLDYQNRRAEFVDAVWDNLANWDFVAENMKL